MLHISRAQVGLEYLMTYGWAFVLVAVVVGAMVLIISSQLGKGACSGFGYDLPITNFVLSAQRAHIVVANLTGYDLSDMDFYLSNETEGELLNQSMEAGQHQGFQIAGSFSGEEQMTITLDYTDATGTKKTKTATCRGKVEGQEEETVNSFADGSTKKVIGFASSTSSSNVKKFNYFKIPPNANITSASMKVGCYQGSGGLKSHDSEKGHSLSFGYGITVSPGSWSGKMVKGVEYAFSLRVYNPGDQPDTYWVTAEERSGLLSDSFELGFSENYFEIAENQNKRIWVYLTPKKSEGTYTVDLTAHSQLDGTFTGPLYATLASSDCPDNPSIDVGNDGVGSKDWLYSGEFSSSETFDFTDALKQQIERCNQFGLCSSEPYLAPIPLLIGGAYPCISDEGDCLIPVILNTDDSGVFELSNIKITASSSE